VGNKGEKNNKILNTNF